MEKCIKAEWVYQAITVRLFLLSEFARKTTKNPLKNGSKVRGNLWKSWGSFGKDWQGASQSPPRLQIQNHRWWSCRWNLEWVFPIFWKHLNNWEQFPSPKISVLDLKECKLFKGDLDAECTVTLSDDVMLEIGSGKLSAKEALEQDKVDVDGNLEIVKELTPYISEL